VGKGDFFCQLASDIGRFTLLFLKCKTEITLQPTPVNLSFVLPKNQSSLCLTAARFEHKFAA